MPPRRDASDAAAQLKRLLAALPRLDDDKAHSLADLARHAGTDEDTLLRDLRTLIERQGDEPPGFVESVSLAVDATHVRLQAPGFFRRPMGLTVTEIQSLELGLAMLRHEAPMEDRAAIERALLRVQGAGDRVQGGVQHVGYGVQRAGYSVQGGGGTRVAEVSHAGVAAFEDDERRRVRKVLQRCIASSCIAEILYQRSGAANAEWRRVRPAGFVFARGRWYCVALDDEETGLRVFRLDRIGDVRATDERFPRREFELSDVVRDGRVLSAEADATMKVRYAPRIARWIAERERVERAADGSVTVEYPLHDVEWAVRSVLQYGAEAEVLEPEEVRSRIRERLERMGN